MRTVLAIVLAGVALLPTQAPAQTRPTDPKFDIQLFYPSPGATSFFSTESGDINRHLNITAGVGFNYSRKPLEVKFTDGTTVGDVIENRFDMDIMGAIGLFDYVDIGIVFPLIVQGGFDSSAFGAVGLPSDALGSGPSDFTPGDLRIIPKIRPYSYNDGMFSVAVIPTVVLPTGGGTEYASERGVVLAPAIALSTRTDLFRVALNAGFRWRGTGTEVGTAPTTVVIKDEVFANVAAGLNLNFLQGLPLEVIAEIYGHTPARNGFGIGTADPIRRQFQQTRTAMEFSVGLRAQVVDFLLVSVGGGGGILPGYGSSAPRIFATISYFLGQAGPSDEDGDGVIDDNDKCPKRKEDVDTWQDEDGCPDLDNDGDNVLDEDDQCPLEKEDRDGFQDEDGCPDPDNDEDTLLDDADQCPLEAEDLDGFQDEDGCPEFDNDEDGIADKVDKCPNVKEDNDGFRDYDGCPDEDNDGDGLADINDLCPNHAEDMDGVVDDDGCPEDDDGDGIPDAEDKCPKKPETYNGIDDEDGCPEKLEAKSLVRVTDEKIEIKEKVFFKSNRADIMSKSFALLDQVAAVLKNYKHLTKIEVQGHTDSRGSKRKNKRLSQARANSVVTYLVDKGIDASRLDAKGYGPDMPIASNRTKRGREQNRRVEFVILEQKPIGVDVAESDQPPPAAEPEIEFNLDVGGDTGAEAAPPPPEAPAEPPTAPGIEGPLFDVGPDEGAAAPEPAPEPDKADKKKKKKKQKKKKKPEDGGDIEFNF